MSPDRAATRLARALVPRPLRNWLRAPRQSAAWAWDELQHLCGLERTVAMRPGWSIAGHPLASRIGYSFLLAEAEQAAELDAFIAECRPGMTLVDAGAHFGVFTLAALHYGGPTARAVAVDPSPTACRIMAIQFRRNGVDARARIVPACVGARTGVQPMVAVGVIASGYCVPPAVHHVGREVTVCEATTLDDLVRRFDLRPTHVKLDVEGAEAAALRGGAGLLSSPSPPLLFIELHNDLIRRAGGDPAEVVALLEELRYAPFAPEGPPLDRAALLGRPVVRLIARPSR